MAINLKKISLPPPQSVEKILSPQGAVKIPILRRSQDVFQSSTQKKIVNVYNAILTTLQGNEELISEHFGGCHGVAIFQDNKLFFAHFPQFLSGKIKKAIAEALPNFKKGEAQVTFISPTSKGVREREFEEYLNMIEEGLGSSLKINYLDYPRKGKGTFKYRGIIRNGRLIDQLINEG